MFFSLYFGLALGARSFLGIPYAQFNSKRSLSGSTSTAGPSNATGRLPALGWAFIIATIVRCIYDILLGLDGTHGMRMDVVHSISTSPFDHFDQFILSQVFLKA